MYAYALQQCFPWVARVTLREAIDIAGMMARTAQEPRCPEGSSFAIISGDYPMFGFDYRPMLGFDYRSISG